MEEAKAIQSREKKRDVKRKCPPWTTQMNEAGGVREEEMERGSSKQGRKERKGGHKEGRMRRQGARERGEEAKNLIGGGKKRDERRRMQ